MTILHLIVSLECGGAQTNLCRLVTQLQSDGIRNVVVSMTSIAGPIAERLRKVNVPLYTLGMKRGTPSIRGIWRLLSIARKEDPDVVHGWMYHANILSTLVAPLLRQTATRQDVFGKGVARVGCAQTCRIISRREICIIR